MRIGKRIKATSKTNDYLFVGYANIVYTYTYWYYFFT